jgi:hypothetical protein
VDEIGCADGAGQASQRNWLIFIVRLKKILVTMTTTRVRDPNFGHSTAGPALFLQPRAFTLCGQEESRRDFIFLFF